MSAPSPDLPEFRDVERAAQRLEGHAHRTPVFTSKALDQRCNASVFLKCENLQRTGSFKFRGAFNAVRLHRESEGGETPVLAFSSGNHAQAIALAAKLHGLPATIVMPSNAPAIKLAATRSHDAEIVLYDPATESREEIAEELERQRGLHLIRAYDDARVIAGQGTVTVELHQQVPELDAVLVCTGGGGLLAGACLATRAIRGANCRVIGVEPEAGDDAARSFRSGQIETVHNPQTIADGARTPFVGQRNFAIIRRDADDIVTVSDDALVEAMRFVWERLKLVIEPTGALALAALFERRNDLDIAPGARIGVTISGGNVDLIAALGLFRRQEAALAAKLRAAATAGVIS